MAKKKRKLLQRKRKKLLLRKRKKQLQKEEKAAPKKKKKQLQRKRKKLLRRKREDSLSLIFQENFFKVFFFLSFYAKEKNGVMPRFFIVLNKKIIRSRMILVQNIISKIQIKKYLKISTCLLSTGKIILLKGKNGSGKTSLIKILLI